MFTQTSWCVFTWLCQCHLELKSTKGSSFFYFDYFFSSKNFNHITKNASILHLKSGDYYRHNDFSTSTPSKHTSHDHNRPIISSLFLTWRNIIDLLQVIDFWLREILAFSLNSLDVLKIFYTFSKSKVYLFCTFFKFKMYL
jgi:hypothetical protein